MNLTLMFFILSLIVFYFIVYKVVINQEGIKKGRIYFSIFLFLSIALTFFGYFANLNLN
jgi:hypothetical protein